jgi:2-polyprenyl-3-methyl-5-hydroxy-6-metoxy-1,4-benzoquinol methylase
VVDNIPRFVDPENYAASFGLQWNEYRTTQLDTYTGTSISADRLTRLVGGSLNIFNGKKVLEAGCGAGRFTEVMLAANAQVFAVDVSSAVEANYMNCRNYPNYFVCQADIRALPLQPEQFDVVVCIGVIQHTPDPEVTMATLCSHVRPGDCW